MTALIENLIKENQNITIAVSLSDLEAYSNSLIEKTKQELQENIKSGNIEIHLTATEVTDMLSIDSSTLWRWNKSGYLKPISIGGKKRYPKSVIDKILKGGE